VAAIAVILIIGLYFLPVIVGATRSVPNIGSIAVINFFLGWTLIGWVVAMAMASRSQPAQLHIQQHQSTGGPALDDAIAKAIAEHEQRKAVESSE
jgi:RsiW-degrading membrane proteinase PrsW (M82 family)